MTKKPITGNINELFGYSVLITIRYRSFLPITLKRQFYNAYRSPRLVRFDDQILTFRDGFINIPEKVLVVAGFAGYRFDYGFPVFIIGHMPPYRFRFNAP